MAARIGFNARLYRNTGSFESPTWDEIENTKDATLNLEVGEADATTRANNGWRATEPTLKDASIEFQMVWNPGDPDFEAIRDAFLNGTTLDMAAMDGDIGDAGNQGLRADMGVFSFTRNEPLDDVISVDVTVKPRFSANAPQWLET